MKINSINTFKKALVTAAVIAGTLLSWENAYAITATQRSCSVDGTGGANVISTTAGGGIPAMGDFAPIAGMSVKVNNGTSARNVILQFSADAGVDVDAEIRLGYSIDGGPIKFFGPQNLANHTQYWETRNNMSVAPIAAGTHTIKAYWRVSGAAGKTAIMDDRCLTAEKSTQ